VLCLKLLMTKDGSQGITKVTDNKGSDGEFQLFLYSFGGSDGYVQE